MPTQDRKALKQYFRNILLFAGILLLCLGCFYYVQAWTDAPAGAPPACPAGWPGCDAPLNVSTTTQTKAGSLNVGNGSWLSITPSLNATYFSGYGAQKINARASVFSAVAGANPGSSFSLIMLAWNGTTNNLDTFCQNLINSGWHAQVVVKGSYFNQPFDDSDFWSYSSVVTSQAEFDTYRSTGTQWWVGCSTLPAWNKNIGGYWQDGGSGKIYYTGNVGIGTSPSAKLHIYDDTAGDAILLQNQSWNRKVHFLPNGYGYTIQVNENSTGNVLPLSLNPSGGNVGIGTTAPAGILDVFSTDSTKRVYLTGNYAGQNQNSSSPKLTFAGYGQTAGVSIQGINTGAYGYKRLAFFTHTGSDYTTESEVMSITAPGDVGIGTASPSTKLAIAGGDFLVNNSAGGDANSGLRLVSNIATTHPNWKIGAQSLVGGLDFTPSTVAGGTTFSTPAMVILGNGSVGIGTTDPSSFKLQVAGSVGPNASASYDIGSSALKWKDAYFSGTVTAGGFSGPVSGVISAPNVSSGAFGANTGGGNYSFPSNVGIGTTASGYKLDVQGASGLHVGNGSYDSNIVFGNNASWLNGIRSYDNGQVEMRIWTLQPSGEIVLANGYNGDQSTVLPTDGLWVKNNLVGLGNFSVTAPGEKLDVSGNIRLSGALKSTGSAKTYGGIDIWGKKNNYSGINFFDGSGAYESTLMVDADGATGMYIEGSGWQWYWTGGTLTAGTVPWANISGFTGDATNDSWTGTGNVYTTSGNVGIGTTDPSSFKLQVAGNVGPNASASYDIGSSALKWKDGYFSGTVTAGAFSGPVSGAISAPNVSAGTFGANTGGGNYSFSGNVGIGTITPDTNLQVYNATRPTISVTGMSTDKIRITQAGHSDAFISQNFSYDGANYNRDNTSKQAWSIHFNDYDDYYGGIYFSHATAGANPITESIFMKIASSGNVGIGTTDPSSFKLQVAGNVGPNASASYDIGSSALKWKDAYFSGTVTAGAFSGPVSGAISAPNVSAGTFGANTGGGNYTFPANLTANGNIYLSAGNPYSGASVLNAQKEQNENTAVVPGAGWYRVAHIDGANGRGQNTVTIYTVGGNYGVYSATIRWYSDWGSTAGITAISELGGGYWTDARVTTDGTNSYLEINFTQALSYIYTSLQYDGGYARGTLYDGTLLAGGNTILATAKLGLLTVGTNKLLVDASGNVGIGTASPGAKLDVNANGLFRPGTANDGTGEPVTIEMFGRTPTGSNTPVGGIKFKWYGQNPSSIEILRGGSSNDGSGLGFYTASDSSTVNEVMRLTRTGNVGINTTDPSSFKLQVAGNVGPNASASYDIGSSALKWKDAYFSGTVTAGAFSGPVSGAISAPNVSAGTFGANTGGGNYAFPSSVGIGTTGPGYTLDVNGQMRAERFRGINSLTLNTYATVNPASNVFLYSQPNDRDSWLYLDSADTGSNWGIYHRQIDSAVSGLPANSIGFVGGGASALQAYISLANGGAFFSGNVGIGTTAPQQELEVAGDLLLSSKWESGEGQASHIEMVAYDAYKATLKVDYNWAHPFSITDVGGEVLGRYNGGAYTYIGGNVGIGTTAPQRRATIVNASPGTSALELVNSAANAAGLGTPITAIDFVSNNYRAYGPSVVASIAAENGHASYADRGQLAFKVGYTDYDPTDSEMYQTKMVINYNGNVGIGTTDPSSFKLQVAGNVGPNANASYDVGSSALKWKDAYFSGTVTAGAFSGPVSGAISAPNVSAGTFGANTGGGNYSFPGNVGIGITGPTSQLQVKGGDVVISDGAGGSYTGGGSGCPWCGSPWTDYSPTIGAGVGANPYYGGKAGGNFVGGYGDYVAGGGAGIYSLGGAGSLHGFGGAGIYAKGGVHGANVGSGIAPAVYADGPLVSSGGLVVGSAYSAAAIRNSSYGMAVTDGNAYISGSVGIGTTNPLVNLHSFGPVQADDSNYNVASVVRLERDNTVASHANAAMDIKLGAKWAESNRINTRADFYVTGYNSGFPESLAMTFLTTGAGYDANVGIGTTDPSSFKLQVAGSVGPNANASYDIGSSGLKWKDAYFSGTVTAGAFSGPVSGAISAPNVSSGTFGANTGGGNYSFPGNVGIGITGPQASLQVGLTGGAGYATNGGKILIGSGNPITNGPEAVNGIEFESNLGGSGYATKLYTNNGGDYLGIATRFNSASWTERLVVKEQTGNVGIGTTAPGSKLEISATDGNNLALRNTSTANAAIARLSFNFNTIGTTAYIDAIAEGNVTPTPNQTSLAFGVDNNGIWSTPLYLKYTGNVGIGTTNPQVKLETFGNEQDFVGLRIRNNIWSCNQTASLDFWNGSGRSLPTSKILTQMDGCGGDGDNIQFQNATVGGAAPTTKLIIKSGGNVGIGTTDPSSFKLQVAGSVGPNANASYDIGSSALKWKDAYFSGTVTAGAFSGPVSGAISAPNVSSGTFGANTGGGNYAFPSSVGIGTAAPGAKLQVGGYFQIDSSANYMGSLGFNRNVNTGAILNGSYGAHQIHNNNGVLNFQVYNSAGGLVTTHVMDNAGNVGIGTTDPGAYKLYVNGPVRIPAKLTVNTIDPIYKIDGKNYATYVSDFAGGVRTETSGLVSLENISVNQRTEQKESASTIIDFENLPTGSDTWLFWQTSNENIADLTVLLTPSFDGKVWYEKQGNKLMIYGSQAGEVSYRFTLPREDDQKWGNETTDE